MESMGGSLQILPVQAIVIRLGLTPGVPPQLTRTAGTGASMFPGLRDCFSIGLRLVLPLSRLEIISTFFIRHLEMLSFFPNKRGERPCLLNFAAELRLTGDLHNLNKIPNRP